MKRTIKLFFWFKTT